MILYCVHERAEKYAHRLENFQNQLQLVKEEYELVCIDSFPASEFTSDNDSKFNRLHLSKKSSEKSCFWKHYDVLNRIADSGECGLVIEDDGIFKSDILFECQKLISKIRSEDNYYINIEYSGDDVPFWFANKSLVKMKGTKRTGGYIVSPAAARNLCNIIDAHLEADESFAYCSDDFVTICWERAGINVFWSVKPLVWQGSKSGRFESDLSFRESTNYFRLYEFLLFNVMPLANKFRAGFRRKIRERVLSLAI
uniref:glycosyltransferase family 25 protein n=1 Tax=Thaumasiovibrio occultus TaxID=1891184 RepID=UPI000B355300|nr:glycosyltransferase family 25 protein [Thaumasiovibrio occultus]